MAIQGWNELPSGFLKMRFGGWMRLDIDVQQLVCELAQSQGFRCALCLESQGLVIDHDHDPDEGTGKAYKVYNIRGLLCGACNWQLGRYERELDGGYFEWGDTSCRISEDDYDRYTCIYESRVGRLIEAMCERRMGSANYWRMRRHHQKFDEWYYDGVSSAWRERLADEEARTVDSPEKFMQVFKACMDFVVEQIKKDPNFRPPENFTEVALKVKLAIGEARATNPDLAAEMDRIAICRPLAARIA